MSGGYLLYSAPNLLNAYIKPASKEEQEKIAFAVRKVIDAKKEDSSTDMNELENQIDQLVYKLYALTEEEIKIIENSSNGN